MINQIVEVAGVKWRVKAKSMDAALDEIAHARCTGSVGSSSEVVDGDNTELIAEVHRLDADGNDVVPS